MTFIILKADKIIRSIKASARERRKETIKEEEEEEDKGAGVMVGVKFTMGERPPLCRTA